MISFAIRMKYRKLDKFIQKLSTPEKVSLNAYLMSGEGPLPEGSNLDAVLSHLISLDPTEWSKIVGTANMWAESHHITTDGDIELPAVRRQLNFVINATDSIDPTTVLLLSRDINDETKLTLQEIDVDSGDYIPVPVEAVAGILREYADTIEKRQEQLNAWGGEPA